MSRIFFLSKDANWQLYRNEVFTYLGQKHGLSIEVLTSGKLNPEIQENKWIRYRIFRNLFSNERKLNFLPGALWYIIKKRPLCVLALNNTSNITEYIAVILCRLLGIKFVWWTHAYDHKEYKSKWKQKLKSSYMLLFLKFGNAIITFSKKGKDYLIDHGLNESKIFVAPNTLNTEKLIALSLQYNLTFDRQKFIEQQFGSDYLNARFIVYSGRLSKRKKVDHLIKAFLLIKDQLPDLNVIIIGDGPCKVEIVSLIQNNKLSNRVFMMGSVFDDAHLSGLFQISDLFVMPGWVGLAIIHAYCYGLPVVTESGEHPPEYGYLKDNMNGYIVPEDDINKMAEVIHSFYSDSQIAQKMKNECLKTVLNEADISNMVDQMNKAIHYRS